MKRLFNKILEFFGLKTVKVNKKEAPQEDSEKTSSENSKVECDYIDRLEATGGLVVKEGEMIMEVSPKIKKQSKVPKTLKKTKLTKKATKNIKKK